MDNACCYVSLLVYEELLFTFIQCCTIYNLPYVLLTSKRSTIDVMHSLVRRSPKHCTIA